MINFILLVDMMKTVSSDSISLLEHDGLASLNFEGQLG